MASSIEGRMRAGLRLPRVQELVDNVQDPVAGRDVRNQHRRAVDEQLRVIHSAMMSRNRGMVRELGNLDVDGVVLK